MIIQILAASFVSVQVGSFSEESRALSVVDELRRAGHDAYFLRAASVEEGQSTYKVRVGKYPDKVQARAVAEKLKQRGAEWAGAYPAETDRAETLNLSADLVALVGQMKTVNPGRVKREGIGKRFADYVHNYLVFYLLDAGQDPGAKLSDLAVWDTNPDNQPEIFPVIDGARAYALYWEKEQSRYALAELATGGKISMGDSLDLTPGPEKFVAVRYERGGDLYSETGFRLYRWQQGEAVPYAEVGTIPLEIADKGVEGDSNITLTRTIEADNVDLDPDREILVKCTVVGKDHLDVWDWNGKSVARVVDPVWFEDVLAKRPNSDRAAEGLFGLGVERGIADDLSGAQELFQLLVSKYPQFTIAARAQSAIADIGRRQKTAQALNQTGFDELKAGAVDLAAADLAEAARHDPGDARILYSLAVARTQTGDTLGALRALARAVELDPDDALQLREKARSDSFLTPLRELPEFKEILQ
jgi:hypothetical protein